MTKSDAKIMHNMRSYEREREVEGENGKGCGWVNASAASRLSRVKLFAFSVSQLSLFIGHKGQEVIDF